MKKKLNILIYALILTLIGSSSFAATLSYTEGKRDQIAGSVVLSPKDAPNAPPGYSLGAIGLGEPFDRIDIFGRVVGNFDIFDFTSSSAFRVDFIFGGFDLEEGGSVGQSGFVIEETGSNSSDFTLDILSPSTGVIASGGFTNDVTSGISFIFGGLAGDYRFTIKGEGAPVLYDIRISAVPLPAALPLMGVGMVLLGLMSWRRKRTASA